MDVFATPAWLVLTALAVGIGVSLLAGITGRRASRVDPVKRCGMIREDKILLLPRTLLFTRLTLLNTLSKFTQSIE